MFKLDYSIQDEAVNVMNQAVVGQIVLPTATGKSKIQEKFLISNITKNPGFAIYCIATPRILLTNQLMKEVSVGLAEKGIATRRVTIHSGKQVEYTDVKEEYVENDKEEEWEYIESQLGHSDATIALTYVELRESISKAKDANVPVLICSTYHSVDRVTRACKGKYKVNAVFCDESQYVVQKDFFASIKLLKKVTSKIFFFTATQKYTVSDDGFGQNNEAFYGAPIYEKDPAEMIQRGYMLRPRLHIVDVDASSKNGTIAAIIEAYGRHRDHIEGIAKMLVACKGSAEIRKIKKSKKFKEFVAKQEEGFKVFDASSVFKYNVDGEEVQREEFLELLNKHKGPAIILHINMLSEGINVPSMTGVLPLSAMGKSKFLQTLGRATRLHPDDRAAFETGKYGPEDLAIMAKPYAYVIVPTFTDEGQDRLRAIIDIIDKLRSIYKFDATQDVIVRTPSGVGDDNDDDDGIGRKTKPVEKPSYSSDLFIEIEQYIESEERAKLMFSGTMAGRIQAMALVQC